MTKIICFANNKGGSGKSTTCSNVGYGLVNMFEFIDEVRQIVPDLSLMGVEITKVDERKNYFKQTI